MANPADAGEGTGLKYLPPTIDLTDDWIAELREALQPRDDIVAAYWVTTVFLDADGSPSQHELHFELRDGARCGCTIGTNPRGQSNPATERPGNHVGIPTC